MNSRSPRSHHEIRPLMNPMGVAIRWPNRSSGRFRVAIRARTIRSGSRLPCRSCGFRSSPVGKAARRAICARPLRESYASRAAPEPPAAPRFVFVPSPPEAAPFPPAKNEPAREGGERTSANRFRMVDAVDAARFVGLKLSREGTHRHTPRHRACAAEGLFTDSGS